MTLNVENSYASTPDSASQASSTARTLIPFALLAIAYFPVFYDLVGDWYNDDNYTHGFLVPLVSAYLIWQNRVALASIPRVVSPVGLVIVAIGMSMFVVANGAAEYFTLRFSFLVTLVGLLYYLFGVALLKKTWFEIFFLIFMIPIPYVLYYAAAFPMQLFASKVTVFALDLIGMNAVRQGNLIHLAGYTLEVAEACSGIRSLMTLMALGALFAYTTQSKFWARLALIACVPVIAVAGNVVRVLLTSILVQVIGEEIVTEPIHSLLGLIVFAVALITLPLAGMLIRKVAR